MIENNYIYSILIFILPIIFIILLKNSKINKLKSEEECKIQIETDRHYANKIIQRENQKNLINRQNAIDEIRSRKDLNNNFNIKDFSNGKRNDFLSDAFITAVILNNISNSAQDKSLNSSDSSFDNDNDSCSSNNDYD